MSCALSKTGVWNCNGDVIRHRAYVRFSLRIGIDHCQNAWFPIENTRSIILPNNSHITYMNIYKHFLLLVIPMFFFLVAHFIFSIPRRINPPWTFWQKNSDRRPLWPCLPARPSQTSGPLRSHFFCLSPLFFFFFFLFPFSLRFLYGLRHHFFCLDWMPRFLKN